MRPRTTNVSLLIYLLIDCKIKPHWVEIGLDLVQKKEHDYGIDDEDRDPRFHAQSGHSVGTLGFAAQRLANFINPSQITIPVRPRRKPIDPSMLGSFHVG